MKNNTAARAVKARVQEWRAAANLRHCTRMARLRGMRVLDGEELREALRDRLDARPHPAWPKPKGGLHIFLAYYARSWERVLPATLRPFGTVCKFEWTAKGFDDTAPDWLDHRDAMNAAMKAAFDAANAARPVDAVVGYLSGKTVSPTLLAHFAASGAAILNFCFDDSLQFPSRPVGNRDPSTAAIAHAVDLNLTNKPSSRIKYAAYGGLAMFWPPGADPAQVAPPDGRLPGEGEFAVDVSFVGAAYGARPAFIARVRKLLADSGIRVQALGQGWPDGFATADELPRIFATSRINIGMGGVGHSRRLMCLKGRDAEVPMAGGLYLTSHNPELARMYEIGREILTYRSAADCARIVRDLIADPARAAAIRAAGHARALRDHTWERRWQSAFEMAGLIPPAT